MVSEDRAVFLPVGIPLNTVDRVNIDEELCLPALIGGTLGHEPLLEATHLDVTLDPQHLVHLPVLNDQPVALIVYWRDSRPHLDGFLIEVIMLVFGELLPPFPAPRQRQPFDKLGLVLDK